MHLRQSTPVAAGEVIPVFKPKGITSFEVVRRTRLALKMKKVGHAGTLDPLAEGLLIVLTGSKTKMMDEILKLEKEYHAIFRLGVTSKSHDLESEIVEQTKDVDFSEQRLEDAMKKFTGRIEQVPPEYSAAWVDGERAYHLARRGMKTSSLSLKLLS